MGLFLLVLSLVLLSVQLSWAEEDPLLPFLEHLDPDHNVHLRWGFDEVQGTILFELSVNTSGWVGLGFSPNGGLTGATIVIGGVGPNGQYFKKRRAVDNSMPLVDQHQNYKLLSLTKSNGKTIMKFQRFFDTCGEDDIPITTLPIKLIYAYGQTDDIMYPNKSWRTKEVNLLRYMPQVNLPNSKFFDMTMTNLMLPPRQTYYHCKIMKAPTFAQKQHIYRVEPVIGNLDLVHHLLLYRCPLSVTKEYETECYLGGKNEVCTEGIAVWAIGGGAFEYPDVAGLPIGGNVNEGLYRLEVHYNNEHKAAGRVDNTGLRFYYTSELRKHDAAILGTGLGFAPGYAIPPNAKAFFTYGLCDTAYFPEDLVSETPHVQVFAVMPHTHLAGRKLQVGHFRDGKQIDFLVIDDHYDFQNQHVLNLGKTKTVKLGDKLLVQCTYNTENRTHLTWGGLSTIDEMCMATIFYYPAMSISSCMSFPDHDALKAEMGATDYSHWLTKMSTNAWNDASINKYQKTLTGINQFLIIFDPFQNASRKTAKIPDLTLIPPKPCSSCCATQCLAWISLLLCLVVQWTSF